MEEEKFEKQIQKRRKSTKKQIVFMILFIVIFVFLAVEVVKLASYTLGKYDKEKLWLYNGVDTIVKSVFGTPVNNHIEEHKASLASLGNIYLTPNMIKGAKEIDGYDFTTGLEEMQEKLKDHDLVIANLATPIASEQLRTYSTVNSYIAPKDLVTTLKELNVQAVGTATYHAMDKKESGVSSTMEVLKEANIAQTGISDNERSKPLILSKNNINIGILSYTTSSNVKIAQGSNILNLLTEENIKADVQFLKDEQVDIIFAYLDDYNKNVQLVTSEHKKNVDLLIDNGVNVVLGGGIAAVQDCYEDEIELADKSLSHIYTIYSLGDFMGGYTNSYAQSSIIPTFEMTKKINKNKKGEIINTQFSFQVKTPIITWTKVNKDYSKKMYIVEDEIEKFNNDKSDLLAKDYNEMKEEYNRILKMYKK